MLQSLRAVAQMPASLWVVASCGVLAGAMVAQQAKAPAAPIEAPAALVATAAPEGAPALRADGRAGTPLRLRDSASPGRRPAAAAPAPTETAGGASRVLLVVLLLVAGVAALMFLKRKGSAALATKRGDAYALKVVSTVRVAGRWQVALVKVPGKTLVLGTTDKGLSLLTTLDPEDELDEGEFAVAQVEPPIAPPLPPIRPPMPTRTPRPTTSPGPDAFLGKLLDELQAGPAPGPVRERPLTPSAEALRARLERYQRKAS